MAKKIAILTDASDIVIAQTMQDFKLVENEKEADEKMKSGKSFNQSILIRLSKDFRQNKITEANLIDSVVKSFNFDKATVLKLVETIKTKIAPTITIVTEKSESVGSSLPNRKEETDFDAIGLPRELTSSNLASNLKSQDIKERSITDSMIKEPVPAKMNSNPVVKAPVKRPTKKVTSAPISAPTPVAQPKPAPRSDDSYREPIN